MTLFDSVDIDLECDDCSITVGVKKCICPFLHIMAKRSILVNLCDKCFNARQQDLLPGDGLDI